MSLKLQGSLILLLHNFIGQSYSVYSWNIPV